MDKVDFRIKKTYLSLYNAFTSLLEEKRFEDITINDLCERAMIRRTTFYKHFADKFEYFSFYLKEICSNFKEQISSEIFSKEINTYFLYMSREMLRFMKKHDKIVQNITDSNMFPILLEAFANQLQYDLMQEMSLINKHKGINDDIEKLEAKAAYYAGGLMNVFLSWKKKSKQIDEDKFINIISELLIKE